MEKSIEKIKKFYEKTGPEILQKRTNKCVTVDFTGVYEGIRSFTRSLRENMSEENDDENIESPSLNPEMKIGRDEFDHKFSFEDCWLKYAEIMHDFELDEIDATECNKTYVSYCSDLDFNEFCVYIYWRTQVRKHIPTDTLPVFLRLYCKELCNFIEYEEIDDVLNEFDYLKTICTEKKLVNILNDAIEEFRLLYSNDFREEEYLYFCNYEVQNIELNKLINQKSHPDLLREMLNRSECKWENFDIYKEHFAEMTSEFPRFYYLHMEYLNKAINLDLRKCEEGEYIIRKHKFGYIVKVRNEYLIERSYSYNDKILINISKDGNTSLKILYGQGASDCWGLLFNFKFTGAYLARYYESIKRDIYGYRGINPLASFRKKVEKYPELRCLYEIYSSEEFLSLADYLR